MKGKEKRESDNLREYRANGSSDQDAESFLTQKMKVGEGTETQGTPFPGELPSGFLGAKIEVLQVCLSQGNFSISPPSYTLPFHSMENCVSTKWLI